MRLNKYTTSELVQKIGQLDERFEKLTEITNTLNCPNAKGTLQIQLDVYKHSKLLIISELGRRQMQLELNFDSEIEIQNSSIECLGSSPVQSLPEPASDHQTQTQRSHTT